MVLALEASWAGTCESWDLCVHVRVCAHLCQVGRQLTH